MSELRTTALRGIPAVQEGQQIGQLSSLVYDHAARRVRGFTVASGDRIMNVWWSDVAALSRQSLEVRPGVPLSQLWHGLGSASRRPVDTLTVRLPDVSGTLYVLDAFLDPSTERILAYEVGTLPRAAAERPGLRIPAADLSWTGQAFQPTGAALPCLKALQATLGTLPIRQTP